MKKLTLSTMLSLLLITTCKQRAGAALSSQQTSFCCETLDPNSIFGSHDNRFTFTNEDQAKRLQNKLIQSCDQKDKPALLSCNADDCPDILPGVNDKDSYCQQAGFFDILHDTDNTFTHEYRMIDDSDAQACVQKVLKNDKCNGMNPVSYTPLQGILVYGFTAVLILICCCLCLVPKRKHYEQLLIDERRTNYQTINDDNESILNPEEQEEHKHPQDLEEGIAAHQPRQ